MFGKKTRSMTDRWDEDTEIGFIIAKSNLNHGVKGFYDELEGMGIDLTKSNTRQPPAADGLVKNQFTISKVNDDKKQVFGWALVSHDWVDDDDGNRVLKQLIDHQDDIVDEDALEEMAYTFVLKYREAGELHERGECGGCIESVALTIEKQQAMGIPEGVCPVGWWLGFQITDDKVWKGIKSGKYKDFSIEGNAVREEVEIDDDDLDDYSIAD